jgi:dTDP-4-amino-4,6-dideoxygalactose transaminase
MEIGYSETLKGSRPPWAPRRGVVAPNRLATANTDFLRALPALISGRALEQLRAWLCEFTGRKQVFFAPSARAAIAQVLALLPQAEVAMPAYTCPVVKTAVQVARKRIIYTDVVRGGLNSTSAEFEPHASKNRILLPTHLYGISTDIENICAMARERGCITIEDAAGALGTRRHGKPLGTFGDIGIYSFERSKRFPAFRGAAVVLNNEHLIDLGELERSLGAGTSSSAPMSEIAFALLYNIATSATIYGRLVLPRQLGKYASWAPSDAESAVDEAVHSAFYARAFHPFQARLVLRTLSKLSAVREKIAQVVSIYSRELRDSGVSTLIGSETDAGGLLRFPAAVRCVRRSEFLREALRRGLFLETNYERILADDPRTQMFPNARWAAENVFLLPLYPSLGVQNAVRIAQEVASIASALAHGRTHQDETAA